MSNNKVYIVGSTNQDIVIQLDRRPNIGETVFGNDLKYFQGGKGANQAIACHKMGATSQFVSMIGDDAFGASLKAEINSLNLPNTLYISELEPTGVAVINVDNDGDNSITVISGSNKSLSIDDVNTVIDDPSETDILLIQNELHSEMVEKLLSLGKKKGLVTVLNSAPPVNVTSFIEDIDYLIVNEHELSVSLGIESVDIDNLDTFINHVEKVSQSIPSNLIVTIGEKGLVAVVDGKSHYLDGHKVDVVDTTGAGDCFCGTFASCLSRGLTIEDTLKYSNYAASLSVQALGASSSYPSHYDVIK